MTHISHTATTLRGSHDHHAVADLQFQALIGDQIDARAVYARDGDAVFRAQAQVGEFFAVERRFRDQDAARHQLGVGRIVAPLLVGHLHAAQEGHESSAMQIFY